MKKAILIITLFAVICILSFLIIKPYWKKDTTKIEKSTDKLIEIDQVNPYQNSTITTKVISAENNTFGYEILVDGSVLIHQPSIPGMPGNEGFKTKEVAQKVADFVAKKIKNNQMPPTISLEELKGLE